MPVVIIVRVCSAIIGSVERVSCYIPVYFGIGARGRELNKRANHIPAAAPRRVRWYLSVSTDKAPFESNKLFV